jgi:hypothetical protein
MKHAEYIGPDCGWNVTKGMRALVRPSDKPGVVLAQFDDFNAARGGQDLAFGWHEFPAEHFETKLEMNNV